MNHKVFNYILLILFLIFLALYYSANAGLIDYQSKYKKELTEEEIIKFEEDIKNGIDIDLNVYRNDESRYNNTLSKATLKVSNGIGNVFQDIMNYFFKQIEKSVSNNDN
jgi:hypothetical protein